MFAPAPVLNIDNQKYMLAELKDQDIPTVQAMLEQSQDFSQLSDGHPVEPDAAQHLFLDLPPDTAPDDKDVYGIWRSDALVGIVEAIRGYPTPEVVWIGLMEFIPSFRGKHLGQGTLSALEAYYAAFGFQLLQLGVLEVNTAGVAFWQQMGFQEIRRKEGYLSGEKIHTVLVLEKRIDQGIHPSW